MLGLYLHIPFCSAICNYCNFNRGLFEAGLKDRYVAALEREIRSGPARRTSRADTIFFGGGTPSLLEPSEIGRLIAACRESFRRRDAMRRSRSRPIPRPRRTERMEQFRAAGVNRVSFGVQSFRDEELQAAGPHPLGDRAREAVREARARGDRQHQPRSDDVAAAADARALAGERRGARSTSAPSTPRSICSSCIRTLR